MSYIIRDPEELPDWLEPSNYRYIATLPESTPTKLVRELQVRRSLYRLAIKSPEELEGHHQWEAIKNTGRRSTKKRYRTHVLTKYITSHNFHLPSNYTPSKTRRRRNPPPKLELSIDPSGSNKLIIEELKYLLQEHRTKHSVKVRNPSFHESHIRKIKDNMIIPYIDLMIWGILTSSSITNQTFADLFLTGGSPNFVSKRITPLAKKVLRAGYLEEMRLYAQKSAKR